MKDYNYKRALDCLNYLTRFVDEIENKSSGSTGIMFDKDGEVIMRTDIGYWKEGNIDLRRYLMNKTKDMPHELLSEREKRALQEAVTWVTSWLGDDAVVGISYTNEDWEEENEID